MCATGKIEYANPKAARTVLNKCRRSKRDRRRERSFYICRVCGKFHLTSNEPKKGKRFT